MRHTCKKKLSFRMLYFFLIIRILTLKIDTMYIYFVFVFIKYIINKCCILSIILCYVIYQYNNNCKCKSKNDY